MHLRGPTSDQFASELRVRISSPDSLAERDETPPLARWSTADV
jgi:hypothetical protein